MKCEKRISKSNALFCFGALIIGAALFATRLIAAEWEKSNPYYEDDAWYDISEWFDGNDYNPTDEVFGRWDDETYDVADDKGQDLDNDVWYGYNTAADNDNWFYDYYDPGYYDSWSSRNSGKFDYVSRYYDYDNDGSYDALVSYSDSDSDGDYDRYSYYYFNDAGTESQKKKVQQQAPIVGRSKSERQD